MKTALIYGAGSVGRVLLAAMQEDGIEVLSFVDKFQKAERVEGIPVKRPGDDLDKTLPIYLAVSMNNSCVVEDLKRSGHTTIIPFSEALRQFPEATQPATRLVGWYRGDPATLIDAERCGEVRHWLSDEHSRQVFDAIIRYREDVSSDTYVSVDDGVQYFPKDIDLFSHIDTIRMVDGGAFTGDNLPVLLPEFQSIGKRVEWVASFEPDMANFAKLADECRRAGKAYPDTQFINIPAGLWSTNRQVSFSADKGTSSTVVTGASAGDTTITVVALDSSVQAARPNFIKMDVEGAEQEAIVGAREIIRSQCPVLAICLYHHPGDLWEIPALIHEINPEYDMYIRVHAELCLETVLYCVPKRS